MSGYAFRSTPALGVHDDLYARAAVFDDGRTRVGIVAMDLIALDFGLVERIRSGVIAQTGIPGAALLLNATHTHGGPGTRTFRTMGPTDPVYCEIVVRKIVGVVRQAAESLRPARLTYGEAPCQIGLNRRPTYPKGRTIHGSSYAGPVAPTVQTLTITDPSGAPFALLMLHACHPVTLERDNLQITADWCGYACQTVREATGDAVTPLLLQGCCGNLNPVRRNTFAAAAENGREVGRAALAAMERAAPLSEGALAFSETVLSLPLLLPDADFEEQAIAGYETQLQKAREENGSKGQILFLEGRLDCARERLAVARQEKPDLAQPFAVQHIRLGGAEFLGLPGEMFVQYQNDFSAQCPRPVFTTAFTNGCHGYVPTAADYPYGGYEVADAFHYYGTLMIRDDCERLIRDEVYCLLKLKDPARTPYSVFAAGAVD
jgi:hypothetical protein